MSGDATGGPVTALVLAGSRGPEDPVARLRGLRHKALVPVAGVAMLARVLDALQACETIGRIAVVAGADLLRDADAPLRARFDGSRLIFLEGAESPSRSVLKALAALGEPFPLLVTTADHPLLTPAMVAHLLRGAPHADAVAGVARAETIAAAYPESVRTYYRFRGGRYSGCNLFLLRRPAAAALVRFWRRLEQYRKRPWRMIAHIGPLDLLRFALGRLSLADAAAALSRRAGVRAAAVELPFAEAAIDVDKPADLALVEAILGRRAAV